MDEPRKRINIVKIKLVKESSVLYSPRKIKEPKDGVELIKSFIEDLDREEFIVICLDTKNQPTNITVASRGCLNASIVHPREIYKTAILSNASSILVAHNHPSGCPSPSREDIEISKRLSESGKILGIKLLDHIIVGSNGTYESLKEGEYI